MTFAKSSGGVEDAYFSLSANTTNFRRSRLKCRDELTRKYSNMKKNFNMKILDCTLRDGGYYNNWDFSPEVVTEYLKPN